MHPIPSRDEELLRRRVADAEDHGQVISDQTAHAIAKWFARAIGPGFQAFLASGQASREFYRELSFLYDQRRPDVEDWLNALVRYSLSQPTVPLPADREQRRSEEDVR
jgi:hypothetical protein